MLIALGAGGNVILSYYTVEIILALGVSQKEALYVYAAKLCFIVIANFCSSYLLVRFNRKNILIVLAIALIISQVLLPVFSERPEMVFKYLSVSIWVDSFQKNIFGLCCRGTGRGKSLVGSREIPRSRDRISFFAFTAPNTWCSYLKHAYLNLDFDWKSYSTQSYILLMQ